MGLLDSLDKRRQFRPTTAPQVLELCRALMSERGEVSGSRLAARALGAYAMLPTAGVDEFLDLLAREFSPDPQAVWRAAERYRKEPDAARLADLQAAVEPPRQELFRRLNMAPGGTTVLVDLRRRLLATLGQHPERSGVDADLSHLFRSWFNRGFLVLQRIDWNTPAAILERLIRYEAVHEIQGWRDLRRRLETDRRCYGFFHPALPGDPLIFIEVALTRGLPPVVQGLIDPDSPVDDPKQADHAVFYSITNCQEGLRGVSFGNFLIKQVAEDLGREFPNLRTFTTLSPVPGFRAWLESLKEGGVPDTERELMARCAQYLLHAKRSDGSPVDPVARFHLANGSRLERINWMGDTGPAGIRRSLGLTANYVYRLQDVEANHEAYARDLKVVSTSALAKLAASAPPLR
jgi:malonyl-CoA decarboxylase